MTQHRATVPPPQQPQPQPQAQAPQQPHVTITPPRASGGSAPGPAAAAPQAVVDDVKAGLLALLKVEAEAREAGSLDELNFLIANETRKLTRARQVFVLDLGADGQPRAVAISGLTAVNRAAPLVQSIERIASQLAAEGTMAKPREFDATAYVGDDAGDLAAYPFKSLVWLPFLRRGGALTGGLLLAREDAWSEANILVAKRLAGTFAHARSEISQRAPWTKRVVLGRKAVLAGLAVLAALFAWPVSLTALAPFEIAPQDPFVVAAPIEGIIEDILVEPNQAIVEGQPLVRFSDTMLRNRLAVAERELLVADARVKKAMQMAFTDVRGRQDLRVAMSEFDLKTAERDFARDMLARSEVKAPRAGLAVFTDKKQMAGRPVGVGERIMLIADPARVEAQLDLAVGDSIALGTGARVKLFLDSEPLTAREAEVTLADYQARVRPGNVLAFRILARLGAGQTPPRLGGRGVAQVYGERVPLAFYVFRRPLTTVRQWLGL